MPGDMGLVRLEFVEVQERALEPAAAHGWRRTVVSVLSRHRNPNLIVAVLKGGNRRSRKKYCSAYSGASQRPTSPLLLRSSGAPLLDRRQQVASAGARKPARLAVMNARNGWLDKLLPGVNATMARTRR